MSDDGSEVTGTVDLTRLFEAVGELERISDSEPPLSSPERALWFSTMLQARGAVVHEARKLVSGLLVDALAPATPEPARGTVLDSAEVAAPASGGTTS
jgi:hypothetical protein